MSQRDLDEYFAAAHAMQTGVALQISRGSPETEPKHLRVGVNSALVDNSALADLLIRKGIITKDEYEHAICQAMKAEARRYEQRLGLDLA